MEGSKNSVQTALPASALRASAPSAKACARSSSACSVARGRPSRVSRWRRRPSESSCDVMANPELETLHCRSAPRARCFYVASRRASRPRGAPTGAWHRRAPPANVRRSPPRPPHPAPRHRDGDGGPRRDRSRTAAPPRSNSRARPSAPPAAGSATCSSRAKAWARLRIGWSPPSSVIGSPTTQPSGRHSLCRRSIAGQSMRSAMHVDHRQRARAVTERAADRDPDPARADVEAEHGAVEPDRRGRVHHACPL